MDRKRIAPILLEILMSSVNSSRVPPELGWAVWEMFRKNRLDKPDGFKVLVKACKHCEPEKTAKVLRGEES
ncbi:MAG: hypothetical protein QW470_02480 [Candidatus Caldarchaeum sp.]